MINNGSPQIDGARRQKVVVPQSSFEKRGRWAALSPGKKASVVLSAAALMVFAAVKAYENRDAIMGIFDSVRTKVNSKKDSSSPYAHVGEKIKGEIKAVLEKAAHSQGQGKIISDSSFGTLSSSHEINEKTVYFYSLVPFAENSQANYNKVFQQIDDIVTLAKNGMSYEMDVSIDLKKYAMKSLTNSYLLVNIRWC